MGTEKMDTINVAVAAALLTVALVAASWASPPADGRRQERPEREAAAGEKAGKTIEAPGASTAKTSREDALVQDILQLRDHLGERPLVESQAFEGFPLQEESGSPAAGPKEPIPDESIFRDQLRRLAQANRRTVGKAAFERTQPPHRAPRWQDDAGNRERVETLRAAAFRLEEVAHQLECLDLYERSDALRSLASELRRDARFLRGQAEGR